MDNRSEKTALENSKLHLIRHFVTPSPQEEGLERPRKRQHIDNDRRSVSSIEPQNGVAAPFCQYQYIEVLCPAFLVARLQSRAGAVRKAGASPPSRKARVTPRPSSPPGAFYSNPPARFGSLPRRAPSSASYRRAARRAPRRPPGWSVSAPPTPAVP